MAASGLTPDFDNIGVASDGSSDLDDEVSRCLLGESGGDSAPLEWSNAELDMDTNTIENVRSTPARKITVRSTHVDRSTQPTTSCDSSNYVDLLEYFADEVIPVRQRKFAKKLIATCKRGGGKQIVVLFISVTFPL